MRIPPDASINVQEAFKAQDRRIAALEALIGTLVRPSDVSGQIDSARAEFKRLLRKPQTLDFNDVFRPAGPAHSIGHVPDPGPYPGSGGDMVLKGDGTWGYPLDGLIQVLPESITDPGTRKLNVLGSLAVNSGLSADSLNTRTLTLYDEMNPYRWDDLRFPAQGINPPGDGTGATIENTTGFLIFLPGGTRLIAGVAQMPHGWKEGSSIEAHIHWTPTNTNTGNVLWRLQYQVRNPVNDAAFDFVSGWTTSDITVAANGVADKAQINDFPLISMTGKTLSALVAFKLYRIGGDAADTYDTDARLLEIDFHYQSDAIGSRSEYAK